MSRIRVRPFPRVRLINPCRPGRIYPPESPSLRFPINGVFRSNFWIADNRLSFRSGKVPFGTIDSKCSMPKFLARIRFIGAPDSNGMPDLSLNKAAQ